jgi:predicted kinase
VKPSPTMRDHVTASVARQLQLGLDVIVDATGHRRVQRRRVEARWESWDEPQLVVDSATEPPEVGLRRVHDHCLSGQ